MSMPIVQVVTIATDLLTGKDLGTTGKQVFDDVQNGFSNGVKNTVHGLADIGKSFIDLSGHYYSFMAGTLEAGFNFVTGGPNTNPIDNYEKNKDWVNSTFDWELGDVRDDIFKVGVTVAAATVIAFTGGLAAGAFALTGAAATAMTVGVGLVAAPFIGMGATQISLQSGWGQYDQFNKICESGPESGGETYEKVCDESGEFSQEKYDSSDLKRNVNGTDLKTMMCGEEDANLIECASYQGGVLTTGFGAYKLGKAIPGVKTIIGGIEEGLGKVYDFGYGVGGGVRSLVTTPTNFQSQVKSSFGDLSNFRKNNNMPTAGALDDNATAAKLELDGQSFYGKNAHGKEVTLKVNAISKTHAETDVFQQLKNSGIETSGKSAKIYVDRELCTACGQNGAVKSMGAQFNLKELTVVTPKNVYTFTY